MIGRVTALRSSGRVVITGMGVVSPNGVGVEAFDAACRAGRSGISALQNVDLSKLKSTAAAQVLGFDPTTVLDPVELRRVPRMIPLALASSREALAMAKLNIDPQDVEQQR